MATRAVLVKRLIVRSTPVWDLMACSVRFATQDLHGILSSALALTVPKIGIIALATQT